MIMASDSKPRYTKTRKVSFVTLSFFYACVLSRTDGFQPSSPSSRLSRPMTTSISMGFFDGLKEAFSNDESLAQDGVKGSIEGPGDDLGENFGMSVQQKPQQTEVQKRWLESQMKQKNTTAEAGETGPGIYFTQGRQGRPTHHRSTSQHELGAIAVPHRSPGP